MAGAIWSAAPGDMRDYPAKAFLKFFNNHGLLKITNRPQWRTVKGGSRRICVSPHPQRIVRDEAPDAGGRDQAQLRMASPSARVNGDEQSYDDVVIAAHADQALAMLSDATPEERRLLSCFRYSQNRAILHRDERLMPKRRRLWSSWNYLSELPPHSATTSAVTYWMNKLQPLPVEAPLFVSLNPLEEPRMEKVLGEFDYTHPIFDPAAMAAQKELWKIQGGQHTWFCGAYWGSGFHEDGIQAGLAAAEAAGRRQAAMVGAGRVRAASTSSRRAPKPPPSRKPSSNMPETCLYRGEVVHRRLTPVRHELRYRVFNLFADVDRLEETAAGLRLFSYNRLNLFSVMDRNHGPGDGTPIREHAWKLVRGADGGEHVKRVFMFCYPSVLGYVFNPLTVYYGFDAEDRLRLMIYEVNNTFGGRHSYVVPVGAEFAQTAPKHFFVSPFNAVEGNYTFHFTSPGEKMALGVALSDRRKAGAQRLCQRRPGQSFRRRAAALLPGRAVPHLQGHRRHPLASLAALVERSDA